MPKQSAARNDKAPKEYQQLAACNAKLWLNSPADQQEATNRQWNKLKKKFSKNQRVPASVEFTIAVRDRLSKLTCKL